MNDVREPTATPGGVCLSEVARSLSGLDTVVDRRRPALQVRHVQLWGAPNEGCSRLVSVRP